MDTSISASSKTLATGAGNAASLLPLANVGFRRSLFFGLTLATFVWGTRAAFGILSANAFTWLEWGIFLLFCLCYIQISLTFAQAVIGFFISLFFRDWVCVAAPVARAARRLGQRGFAARPLSKTALVMPVYNEDAKRVSARLRAMAATLPSELDSENFGIFVLSDTQDEQRGQEEAEIFAQLAEELASRIPVHYRRRVPNRFRKAGNIMEFCQNQGADFDYMIVLDADSVMSGQCMLELITMMDARPSAGIIQTCPLLIFSRTFFARALQFAHRLSGELLTAGASFWQQGQGNYFGHNAIIRIAPFVQHCQLPVLSGSGPLGGEVLSHDFVEAAYLVRAGYEVWNIPSGKGSYEELPPNVIDYAKRERRWCQGNIQHSRIVCESKLHPVSRFHLVMGILAYLSAPIWFLLILFSLARFSHEAFVGPVYFTDEHQLFPNWPEWTTPQSLLLFFSTLGLLLSPKIFGFILALFNNRMRRNFGGAIRLAIGFVLEIIASSLLAPVMMVYNSMFVGAILTGQGVAWSAQPRDARGIGKREAFFNLLPQIILALCMLAIIVLVLPDRWAWYAPLLAGLIFSLPFTVFSSRFVVRPRSLFLTPEERDVPPVIAKVAA